MITKTVDAIVRESLLENGLGSLHKYHFFLQHALSELQQLSIHHRMSAKQVELPVNGYMRASIPEYATYILDVSIKSGERLLPAYKDSKLNKLYNFDGSGNKIAHPTPADEESSTINFLTDFYRDGEIYGVSGYFGLSAPRDRSFNIDLTNSEIVFSNQFDKDVVVVTYAVDPVSTTSANLLTYEYAQVLKAKMRLEYRINQRNRFSRTDVMDAKRDYNTAKRNARSLVYGLSMADFYYAIRRGLHAAPKS